jgi:hypothetical protein
LIDAIEELIAWLKASLFGAKMVIPCAPCKNSIAETFVPFGSATFTEDMSVPNAVALMAVTAVVRFPGGMRTAFMLLINRFSNTTAFETVMFSLEVSLALDPLVSV